MSEQSTAVGAGAALKRKREDEEDSNHAEKKVKIESASTSPAAAPTPVADSNTAANGVANTTRKKRRWDMNEPVHATASNAATIPPTTSTSSNIVHSNPNPPSSTSISVPATASGVLSAAEKAAALQKSIADRLAALKVPKPVGATAPSTTIASATTGAGVKPDPSKYFPSPSPTIPVVKDEAKSWVPLRLDAQGRPIDEKGNLIIQQRPLSLSLNQRNAAANATAAAPGPKLAHAKISTTIYKDESQSKFFDPRMRAGDGPHERKSRPLEFVKPGKYIQQAATLRMRQLEKEMFDAAAAMMKEKASATPMHTTIQILKPGPIPPVEWWDAKILKDPTAGYPEPAAQDDRINWDKITSYVYHPVEIDSLTSAPPPPPMPVLLTKKERAKIKKRDKREAQREARDRIRLGIDAPPEPKMRLQNLMNVLLNDSVADPSAMEAKVRAQQAQRVETHLEANAARKLTPEQKAEKRRRKYQEDISHEVHVAVYKAGELSDGKARYQIDVNTSQWNLYGLAMVHPDCSVVIVEGGPKNQRRFKRLMLRRIKWKRKKKSAMEKASQGGHGDEEMEEDDEEDDEDESDSDSDSDDDSAGGASANDDANLTRSRTGACALLWSGIIPKTRFPNQRFTFEYQRSEAMARNYLQKLGMENYWDMARAYQNGNTEM